MSVDTYFYNFKNITLYHKVLKLVEICAEFVSDTVTFGD